MHLPIRFALAAGLCLASTIAIAQENAVVLFDAQQKTISCVISDMRYIPPSQNCAGFLIQGYLVQGQRNQLRVTHRRFLTNYSFYVDKVTPIHNFAIEDLNEAANLAPLPASPATGVSKGAVPKGLATSGTLALRTAQDLIAELLNPATVSNPANELASDWVVVKREVENVRNDADAFDALWSNLHRGPDNAAASCLSAFGAPTLISAVACLNLLNEKEHTKPFVDAAPTCGAQQTTNTPQRTGSQTPEGFGAHPADLQACTYDDEDEFRKLIVRDNDAIAMVALLGSTLAQQTPLLTNQLSAFDGDLASLRADMNTLAGNVQALQDAEDLLGPMRPEMAKAQIKARLMQTLNGGAKPVLDDAELNKLTDKFYDFAQSATGHQESFRALSATNLLWFEAIRQTYQALGFASTVCSSEANGRGARLGCLADQIDGKYSPKLQQAHANLNQCLPTQITQVNIQQSRLLARANEIYDSSQVAVPLDKAIDLGGNSGNLHVHYTIYETETFPRFSIPSSSSASAVVTAAPATIAMPPAASTTTTTTAAATTSTTSSAAQPSGTPVSSSVLDVHDRYRATMVAAFAFSPGLKETSIQTTTIFNGTATVSTAQNPIVCTPTATCTQVTVSTGPAHSSVILGMSFHPYGYDTFPKAFSWKHPRQAFKEAFGIFGGLSVQNLNDYYFGPDLQIAHGVQFMGGVNFYRQDQLAVGFMNGGTYPSSPTPAFTGPQKWTHGAYFGIGLNLSIFRKAFGSVTGLGVNAANKGS